MNPNNWNVPDKSLRKQATLHDVAQDAGVSKSTVSLVLQDNPQVKDQTREKVLRSIEATGYVYNRKAAALRQAQSSDLIGILVNSFVTPYSAEILNCFEQVALSKGLVPMMASNGEQLDQQERFIKSYMEHKVSGFIICPAPNTSVSWLDKIWRSGFPLVQIMREVPFSQFPAVIADNRNGVREATRHLISLGHQKIAFVGGDEAISDYHERLGGYMDAMSEAGLSVPEAYVLPISQGRAAGRQVLQTLLSYKTRVTAIVCFSDLMAYGILSMSRELGIEVGKDLAVIGFDDLADSSLTHPALTTVRVQPEDFAISAMEMLQNHIQNSQVPAERRVIPAKLIVRESCGAPQNIN
ncbi:MAG: LacI family transcriptional regulator [Gammaproteobacteria bacterium]|nr:LacI family transcriptional regulator [Gammaproteobacteria bacterium]